MLIATSFKSNSGGNVKWVKGEDGDKETSLKYLGPS